MKIALGRAYQRIEDLERMVQNLSYQAFVDDMTGLPNYRAFSQSLDQLIAEGGRGRKFGLVMIDVDHFKRVNDTFGHQVGDDVLRHVGAVLHSASRKVDFVGRYGGEEFCMLLPDADLNGAVEAAERARASLEAKAFGFVSITASFGMSAFKPYMTAGDLKKEADDALYRAKIEGRNCVVSCS